MGPEEQFLRGYIPRLCDSDVKRVHAAADRIAELERQLGNLKAAFRANMLRRAQPSENIDAEIDRVLAALDQPPQYKQQRSPEGDGACIGTGADW